MNWEVEEKRGGGSRRWRRTGVGEAGGGGEGGEVGGGVEGGEVGGGGVQQSRDGWDQGR